MKSKIIGSGQLKPVHIHDSLGPGAESSREKTGERTGGYPEWPWAVCEG